MRIIPSTCEQVSGGTEYCAHFPYPVEWSQVYDGIASYARTNHLYSSSIVRYGDGVLEWLGYDFARVYTYDFAATSGGYGSMLKYEEYRYYRGTKDQPDPRKGKLQTYEVWDKPKDQSGGVILAVQSNTWKYSKRVGGDWVEQTAWTAEPTWVWQKSADNWSDGAGSLAVYAYAAAQQNGVQYGNVTAIEERGRTDNPDLSYTAWVGYVANGQLALWRKTTTEYFPNTTANIADRPARVRVFDGSGATCVAETRYIYDNANNSYTSAPVAGLLAKSEQALAGCSDTVVLSKYNATWASVRLTYDAYGNETKRVSLGEDSSGADDDTLKTVYDSFYHLFPVEQYKEQAPTFRETAEYYGVNADYGVGNAKAFWGAMAEHCGVNEVCTRQSYDEHGRAARRWEYAGGGTAWGSDSEASVVWSYHLPGTLDVGQKTAIVTEWRNPRCYGNFVRKHYDGLGRLRAESLPDQDWETNTEGCGTAGTGAEREIDYGYNALGLQTRVSTPRTLARGAYKTIGDIAWSSVADTRTDYDALGRAVLSVAPNGELTNLRYYGRKSQVRAIGRGGDDKILHWQELNGLGYLRYLKLFAWDGSAWVEQGRVTLAHDVQGNLTQAEHAGGLGVISLSYDSGGRKLSLTDADLGAWSYAYDRQGRLVRQTDARGQTACLYYDAVGRLEGKHLRTDTSCPSAPSYQVTFGYDAGHGASNRSRGQLTSVAYASGAYSRASTYNGQGLLAGETVHIQGGAAGGYATQYGYDACRRPATVTYPDGDLVTTGYNSMGLPETLTSKVGSTTTTLAAGARYDVAGRLVKLRLPGASPTLYRLQSYYNWSASGGNGNGRLSEIRVGTSDDWERASSYDRLRLQHSYDGHGNLSSLTERVYLGTAHTRSFGYDAYNRVTAADGLAYAWQPSGNFTSFEGKAYSYGGVHRHAVDLVDGVDRYNWNANGAMTLCSYWTGAEWATQALSWDAENRLASVDGAVDESYVYDEAGVRVKKVNSSSGTTFYPNRYYEVAAGAAVRYYYLGERLLALRQGSEGYTYLHADHLGSVLLSTGGSGASGATSPTAASGRPAAAWPASAASRGRGRTRPGCTTTAHATTTRSWARRSGS